MLEKSYALLTTFTTFSQSRLEDEVYSTSAAVDRVCLLSDRNQSCMVAVVLPRVDFILKVAASLNIAPPAALEEEMRARVDPCTSTGTGAAAHLSSPQHLLQQALRREESLESRSPWFRFLCSHPAVSGAVLASIVSAGHVYSNAHGQGTGDEHAALTQLKLTAQRGVDSRLIYFSILIITPEEGGISRNIRGTKLLRDFEVPAAVILDADSWSQRNGMLTVTGKPRRDRVRSKFLTEMQDVYSALSMAHTDAPHNIPTAAAGTPVQAPSLFRSPLLETDPTPAASSSMLVTDCVLPVTIPQCSSPPRPPMSVADRTIEVASLSAYWASKSHARQAVAVRFPGVLELSCTLQAPFAALVMSLSHTVGPSSVAKVENRDLPPFPSLPFSPQIVLCLAHGKCPSYSPTDTSPAIQSSERTPSRLGGLPIAGGRGPSAAVPRPQCR